MAALIPIAAGGLSSAGSFLAGVFGSAGGALGGLGAAASGAAGVVSAVSGANAAKSQADAQEAAARQQRQVSALNAARQRRANRLAAARDRANAVAGGVASGTTLGLLTSNAGARELDTLTSSYNDALGANQMQNQAAVTRAQAPGILLGGLLSSASPFLTDSKSGRAIDPLNYEG